MKRSIGAKTIIFPTPVFIIGTYDKEGKPNAMAVAWGGICCSSPPCVSIALREATCWAQVANATPKSDIMYQTEGVAHEPIPPFNC